MCASVGHWDWDRDNPIHKNCAHHFQFSVENYLYQYVFMKINLVCVPWVYMQEKMGFLP